MCVFNRILYSVVYCCKGWFLLLLLLLLLFFFNKLFYYYFNDIYGINKKIKKNEQQQ